MDRETRRFIQDQETRPLKEDREAASSRTGGRGSGPEGEKARRTCRESPGFRQGDEGPRRNPLFPAGPPAVYPDPALSEEPVQGRKGEFRQGPAEDTVEPAAPVVRRGPEFSVHRGSIVPLPPHI
jgi:hypothetical protein